MKNSLSLPPRFLLPRLLVCALVCALTPSAIAQIALPTHSSTYSGSPRGFQFQAPTTFTVTHLMVPDEQKVQGATQLVALFKMTASPPPCCGSSGTSTPVFTNYTTAPGRLIPVIPPVTYQPGEWLLVLGAVTATGRGGVSYGGSPVPSSVLGNPITLYRAGIQANMQATNAFASLFGTTSTTSIGRVRVFVAGQGKAEPYGQGTGFGSNPPGEIDFSDPFPPGIGQKAELILKPGTASNTGGVLGIGLQRSNVPSPFGILLNQPILVYLTVTAGPIPIAGTPVWFNIPNSPSLAGVKVTFQAGIGASGSLSLTNGMEWEINK